jgi:hypothetical protein
VEFEFAPQDGGPCDLSRNNLGGWGPTTGPEEIRYEAVGNADGTPIDLVVRATSAYETTQATENGCDGNTNHFGVLGVRPGTEVDLQFEFQNSTSGAPLTLGSFYFSFFDFDERKRANVKGGKEQLTVWGFDKFALDSETVAVTDCMADPSDPSRRMASFSSTQNGGAQNDPTDPMRLVTPQKKKTVTLQFQATSGFRAKYSVTECQGTLVCSPTNRRLIFAGKTITLA